MIHINHYVNEWCVYAVAAAGAAAALAILYGEQRNKEERWQNATKRAAQAPMCFVYAGKDGQRQNHRETGLLN